MNDFPTNPFPNVDPKAPSKRNKKKVTEDYVHVNLERDNWNVYEAYQDIGIDRVITRTESKINITRFIQIKTRSFEGNSSSPSYTLKPKDFPTDPRTVFLFYCDSTQDFLIFFINDYIDVLEHNNKTSFISTPTFKYCNNKIGPFKFINENNWQVTTTHQSINKFLNQNGIDKIKDSKLETDDEYFNIQSEKILKFRRDYMFKFKYMKNKPNSDPNLKYININIDKLLLKKKSEIISNFKKNSNKLNLQNESIKDSSNQLRLLASTDDLED